MRLALRTLVRVFISIVALALVAMPNSVQAQAEVVGTWLQNIAHVRFVGRFPKSDARKILPLSEETIQKSMRGRIGVLTTRIVFDGNLGELDSYVDTGVSLDRKDDYKVAFSRRNTVMTAELVGIVWIFYREQGFSREEQAAVVKGVSNSK